MPGDLPRRLSATPRDIDHEEEAGFCLAAAWVSQTPIISFDGDSHA